MKAIIYKTDGAAAKAKAAELRAQGIKVQAFDVRMMRDPETLAQFDEIIRMPDISNSDREMVMEIERKAEPEAEAPEWEVRSEPGGLHYVTRHGRIDTGPFPTASEADAALNALANPGKDRFEPTAENITPPKELPFYKLSEIEKLTRAELVNFLQMHEYTEEKWKTRSGLSLLRRLARQHMTAIIENSDPEEAKKWRS